jgi:hypothetical protein
MELGRCTEDVPVEPITATYTRDEDQFQVVVTGHGQSRTGVAPDIIAARDLADQLAAELVAASSSMPVVVHLLDGSGVAFIQALLTARLGLTLPLEHVTHRLTWVRKPFDELVINALRHAEPPRRCRIDLTEHGQRLRIEVDDAASHRVPQPQTPDRSVDADWSCSTSSPRHGVSTIVPAAKPCGRSWL